jgi:hypothetical protein
LQHPPVFIFYSFTVDQVDKTILGVIWSRLSRTSDGKAAVCLKSGSTMDWVEKTRGSKDESDKSIGLTS